MADSEAPPLPFLLRHKGEVSFVAALGGLLATLFLRQFLPETMPGLLLVLQTGFEAGTVGGAADWLAVRMIFSEIRLGRWKIVPASGIIPRKQQAIARGAGRLVADEWLSPASVRQALAKLDISDVLADYLKEWHRSGESEKAVTWLLNVADEVLARPTVPERSAELVRGFLEGVAWSKALGRHVTEEQARQLADHFVPFICDRFADLLTTPDAFEFVHRKFQEEQDSFLKKLLFDPYEAAEKAVLKAIQVLREIQYDETHPIRRRITDGVADWLERLRESGDEAASVDRLGQDLVDNLDLRTWVEQAVAGLRDYLAHQREDMNGPLRGELRAWIERAIDRLETDASWKETINRKASSAVGSLLEFHHDKIAAIVEMNLNRLSPEEISRQFRTRTYDDMQWIRVNGAVAGFAIGLLIGCVRWLLD